MSVKIKTPAARAQAFAAQKIIEAIEFQLDHHSTTPFNINESKLIWVGGTRIIDAFQAVDDVGIGRLKAVFELVQEQYQAVGWDVALSVSGNGLDVALMKRKESTK